jgi:hypothetical protein
MTRIEAHETTRENLESAILESAEKWAQAESDFENGVLGDNRQFRLDNLRMLADARSGRFLIQEIG